MSAKRFVVAGLGIALLVAILAPFLASPNPDGLESAAEKFKSAEGKSYQLFNSPFPDYTIPFIGETPFSSILALVIGMLFIFWLTYGITKKTKTGA